MKKLKLDIDELKVESFATIKEKNKKQGTVYGNVTYTLLPPSNCGLENTCLTDACGCTDNTCDNPSCGNVC